MGDACQMKTTAMAEGVVNDSQLDLATLTILQGIGQYHGLSAVDKDRRKGPQWRLLAGQQRMLLDIV
tara:strand:+ start:7562 stop:7762 length:201 start_codon:yes stop_codon:yes gene_type:complete